MDKGDRATITFICTGASLKENQYGPYWIINGTLDDKPLGTFINGYGSKHYDFFKGQSITAKLEYKGMYTHPQGKYPPKADFKCIAWNLGDKLKYAEDGETHLAEPGRSDSSPESVQASTPTPAPSGVGEEDFLALVTKVAEIEVALSTLVEMTKRVEGKIDVIAVAEVFGNGDDEPATVEKVEGPTKETNIPF